MNNHKATITLLEVNCKDSDKVANTVSEILDLFLQQYLVIAIYIGLYTIFGILMSNETAIQNIWVAIFHNNIELLTKELTIIIGMAMNALFAVLLYFLLLCIMSILSVQDAKNDVSSKYSGKAKVVLFLFQLIFFTIMFFIEGINDKDGFIYITMALTSAMLYLGFSVSLTSIAETKNLKDFCYCFIEIYKNTGLSMTEVLLALVFDVFFLIMQLLLGLSKKYLLILVVIFSSTLLILIKLNKLRQQNKDKFIAFLKSLPADKRVVLCRLGAEKVLFKKINTEFEVEYCAIDNVTSLKEADYLLILNTAIRSNEYLDQLSEIMAEAKSDSIVLDPSISSGVNRSPYFTWFSIPNPNPRKITVERYKKIISTWRNRSFCT